MKSVLALAAMVLVSATSFAKVLDVNVNSKVRSSVVFLRDVKIEVKDSVFESTEDKLFKSKISFLVSGRYDGGYCNTDDLVLQVQQTERNRAEDQTNSFDKFNLNLLSLEKVKTGNVDLLGNACAYGTEGSFTLPIQVSIGMWMKGQQTATYEYTLPFGMGPKAKSLVLTVGFDKDKGWSYQVK